MLIDNCNTETNCPYINLLTRELDLIHTAQTEMNTIQSQMSTDIALLKYKSGLFGGLAGLIPGIISAVIVYVQSAPH